MDRIELNINGRWITDIENNDLNIPISYYRKLINTVNKHRMPSTKPIELPCTKQVNAALGNPVVLDSQTVLGGNDTHSIKILQNGDVVMIGNAKITGGFVGPTTEYVELTVVRDQLDWLETFKNTYLRELDTSGTDHELDTSNIYLGQFASQTPDSLPCRYAPIDTGYIGWRSILFMKQSTSGGTTTTEIYYTGEDVGNGVLEDINIKGCSDDALNIVVSCTGANDSFWNPIHVYKASTTALPETDEPHNQQGYFEYQDQEQWEYHDFIPMAPLSYIFERAFNHVGYTIGNTWVDDNLDDIVSHTWNTESWLKSYDDRCGFKVAVLEGDLEIPSTPFTSIIDYPFTLRSEAGYLDASQYSDTGSDTPSTVEAGTHESHFEADEEVYMIAVAKLQLFALVDDITLGVYDNTGTTLQYTIASYTTGGSATHHDIVLAGGCYLNPGEKLKVVITFNASSFRPRFLGISTFEGHQMTKLVQEQKMHCNDYLPDATIYDWLKDMDLFRNLHIFENHNSRLVYILPDQSMQTTRIENMIGRHKTEAGTQITRVALLHPAKYRFDWLSDSEDWEMTSREEISGRIAGGDINNPHDMATGSETIEMGVYAATINGQENYFKFWELGVPTLRGEDRARKNYQSRLFTIEVERDTPDQTIDSEFGQLPFYVIGQTTLSMNYCEFPASFHLDQIQETWYEQFMDALENGYILRGSFDISPNYTAKLNDADINDLPYRYYHRIKIKGVEVKGVLQALIDYQTTRNINTIAEFLCKI